MGCLPCIVVEPIHAKAGQLFVGYSPHGRCPTSWKVGPEEAGEDSTNSKVLVSETRECFEV